MEDPENAENVQRSQFRLPEDLSIASRGLSFLLRAEVMMPSHATLVREMIVEFQGGPNPYLTHEWRRGERRFAQLLESFLRPEGKLGGSGMPSC